MLTPYGVGVLMFVWVLGRTFLVVSIIHASLFFKLNGCYLLLVMYLMFNLNSNHMEKKSLCVNNEVSKKIIKVCEFFKIISYIALLAGVIMVIKGATDYFHPELATVGVCIFVSAMITLLINLPFIRGFVTLVESAEYTKANIEVYYDIKEQEYS